MTWEEQYYSAQMCGSEADIDALYHFSSDPGGFASYRSQIPASKIWPMAVLLEVEVPHKLRLHGVGTAAVERFLDAARTKGAVLAFLRVSWCGELSERDRMVLWYRKRGWQLLQIPPVEGLEVPFMYYDL